MDSAIKQDVGASASRAEDHVLLNSGHQMPLFGWGTAEVPDEAVLAATKSAIKLGYRHIDTAEMYGNEAEIGKGLQEAFKAGSLKREDVFVTSKLGNDHHAADKAQRALKDTLARLQLDYVDLYLIHWPVSEKPGSKVDPPFIETWRALEEMVRQGLAKSIGLSNFSPQKIETFISDVKIRPAANQVGTWGIIAHCALYDDVQQELADNVSDDVEMHAYWRNDRVFEWCKQQGIHVTAYGPLSSPGMAASMDKDHLNLLEKDVVHKMAKRLGKTPPQVLLRWGLQHGNSVIPKASTAEHQKENLGALGWELSEEDYKALSNLRQERVFGGSLAISDEGPWHNYEELWDEPKVAPAS